MVTAPLASLASNGETIPLVGLGTAEFPFNSTHDTSKQAALHAIQLGYRHFDTAALYGTEQALGEAIAEALRLGLIKSREELFITSKLWASNAHRDLVLPAIKSTLKNLGLDYLDLYLIDTDTGFPFEKKEILPIDLESIWEAMEECQKLGLTKSVGVGNFSVKKLEKLLATAKILPAVDQVEMNPVWQQKKLREFCKKKGIHKTAYSPLGGKGTPWGTDRVSEVLKEIASSRGKSAAQVSLRWVHEQGVSLVVKSFDEGRMKENLDIFDWKFK